MPKEGFRSITVTDEMYADMENAFRRNRTELRKLGIMSMTGFAQRMFFDGLKQFEGGQGGQRGQDGQDGAGGRGGQGGRGGDGGHA